jgi:hypothetical protein
VHGYLADTSGGAWSFSGSMMTFVFPMILFIAVAAALYVLYTKPELIPGHRDGWPARSVSQTNLPGQPTAPATPADAATTTEGVE